MKNRVRRYGAALGLASVAMAGASLGQAAGGASAAPANSLQPKTSTVASVEAADRPAVLTKVPHSRLVLRPEGFEQLGRNISALVKKGEAHRIGLNALPLDRRYFTSPILDPMGSLTQMGHHEVTDAFLWNKQDRKDDNWLSQGITTSANASPSMQTRRWVMVTWHSKGDTSSRVSFVDFSNPYSPEKNRYRHVRLVVPTAKGFKQAPSHAGGGTVVGNLLYLDETHDGFRVFDLTKLLMIDGPEPQFVLPQVGSYEYKGEGACESGTGGRP
jgi:hypothetical protein